MTWLFSLALGRVGGLGLAGIASTVVLLGFGFIVLGLQDDRSYSRPLGLNILGGFVGAAFLAAVDAGLKLLGA
jgi:hypothetical protein